VSSFSFDQGLNLSVNTRLLEYEPDRLRSVYWIDIDVNQIIMKYSLESNQLCMIANILGYLILNECIPVNAEEWNGTDGLWHTLSFELVGNHLVGLRDSIQLFEVYDDMLLQVAKTGYIKLVCGNGQFCYDDLVVYSLVEEEYICGDANADEVVNVSDAIYILNYIFLPASPAPDPPLSGDVDCEGNINISDVVYIINFIFSGGNPPCDTDGNDDPDC
jgi:hypothetical protein